MTHPLLPGWLSRVLSIRTWLQFLTLFLALLFCALALFVWHSHSLAASLGREYLAGAIAAVFASSWLVLGVFAHLARREQRGTAPSEQLRGTEGS